MNLSLNTPTIQPTVHAHLPAIIENSHSNTAYSYLEFFAATIRNPNTRDAYRHALNKFFLTCEQWWGLADIHQLNSLHIATYIERLAVV